MPTRRPWQPKIWAIRRTVVVLPLVPATATTGIRPLSLAENMVETIASPTARPLPNDGCKCMRKPGAALTSTTPTACSFNERCTLSHTRSTPHTSNPTICAAATAQAASSGCTSSVTSVAVPPVLRLALLRRITRAPFCGTESTVKFCAARLANAISSIRILVKEVAWP